MQRIGPYQRPAPPKIPIGLRSAKVAQKPQAPLHETEERAQALLRGMIQKVVKPGRPPIHDGPMTPAERQARRRGIRDALKLGDAHGKSHAEIKSGGYDAAKLDTMYGLGVDWSDDSGTATRGWRQVAARGNSNASQEQSYEELFNSGESDFHRGGFDGSQAERIHVSGLRTGTEESNRQQFAEDMLEKLAGEQFESVVMAKSPSFVQRHVGSVACRQGAPETTYTCKLCGDAMNSIGDAKDHLRVDHRKAIKEFFKALNPPREFRDMGNYVTVAIAGKRTKAVDSAGCEQFEGA